MGGVHYKNKKVLSSILLKNYYEEFFMLEFFVLFQIYLFCSFFNSGQAFTFLQVTYLGHPYHPWLVLQVHHHPVDPLVVQHKDYPLVVKILNLDFDLRNLDHLHSLQVISIQDFIQDTQHSQQQQPVDKTIIVITNLMESMLF